MRLKGATKTQVELLKFKSDQVNAVEAEGRDALGKLEGGLGLKEARRWLPGEGKAEGREELKEGLRGARLRGGGGSRVASRRGRCEGCLREA